MCHGWGDNKGELLAKTFFLNSVGGFNLLYFDHRSHGESGGEYTTIGCLEVLDFQAAMAYLRQHRVHCLRRLGVFGLSMGAAVALNFALRHPTRLLGLVLHRPAWLDGPRRDNTQVFTVIAGLIRKHGAEQGLALFKQSDVYQQALANSKANAASLVSQFLQPRAEEAVVRLEKIPLDAPCSDRLQWRSIAVPVLVLANDHDSIHPLEYGVTLAREIPGAEFKELTSKSISVELHQEETQRFLKTFLLEHF